MASELEKPEDYDKFLKEVKAEISSARTQAILKVNEEQLKLYWKIGKELSERRKNSNWGDKVIDQASKDLKAEFPDIKGFSKPNLKKMRLFSEEYPNFLIGSQAVSQLPWGHIMEIIQKVKDPDERNWYAERALENGWTRGILINNIKSKLIERKGAAPNNFDKSLTAHADIAKDIVQDPYTFSFLNLEEEFKEHELEKALLNNLQKFMSQLGDGFAFIGNQKRFEVGNREFFVDLLFFHTEANCYIVIELKRDEFDPIDSGQLSFYVETVDRQLKREHHNPTIGILICSEKNETVVEYALSGSNQPLAVSSLEQLGLSPKKLEAGVQALREEEQDSR